MFFQEIIFSIGKVNECKRKSIKLWLDDNDALMYLNHNKGKSGVAD